MAVANFSPPKGKKKRKRWHFLWKKHVNRHPYPPYHVSYTFKWDKLALLIALVLSSISIIGLLILISIIIT